MIATRLRRLATAVMIVNMIAMALCNITGDMIGFATTLFGAALAGAARIHFKEEVQAMPGYRETAMSLRYEMSSNPEWAPGEQLPSHTALARQFGTTRTTMRRAIELLTEEGLLEVHPGKGTFVAGHQALTTNRTRAVERHVRRNAQLGLDIANSESLAVNFSVSASTVRRLMARLCTEGVVRKSGRGYEAP